MNATYKPVLTRSLNGGVQHKYEFANGYGASVVRHSGSYGHEDGLWEAAVLGPDGHLDYSTPVTSDVEGWLDEQGVDDFLDQVAGLGGAV